MKFKCLAAPFAAAVISTAVAALMAGAAALPLGGNVPPAAPAVVADVELAHGCNRGIQRDYSGWHFHTRACVRRPTAPPGLYDAPAYRRFYRGPVCSYQCRHVGPTKSCTQVCR